MKRPKPHAAKEAYKRLRTMPFQQLWEEEAVRFNSASAELRAAEAGLIRAVAAACRQSGSAEDKAAVKAWLIGLLADPEERIRRYAMTALPRIEGGPDAEAALLALWKSSENKREKKYLEKCLNQIGGEATLELFESGGKLPVATAQKAKAAVARSHHPSEINLESLFSHRNRLRIQLRCREGLEEFVRAEVEELFRDSGMFRVLETQKGWVAIAPLKPFTLGDLYRVRGCATAGFVLGTVRTQEDEADSVAAWASLIASPLCQRLMQTFTRGALRYRLGFIGKGADKGLVKDVVAEAFSRRPAILNDAREAPWAIEIHPKKGGTSVELRPRLSPDPRWQYRVGDVPASSHPPLAACMARLGRVGDGEIVWDPFCGAGLELIERSLLGGVKKLFGTDLSAEAVAITRKNIMAAGLDPELFQIECCDFRDFKGLGQASVTLVITNPPMGRRVRIAGLREMMKDLFRTAAEALQPGGKMVLVNPCRMENPQPSLRLELRKSVDLGGFRGHLEVYCRR